MSPILFGRALLTHLCQGPAVPDGDRDSAKSCRGRDQQGRAPQAALFRCSRAPARHPSYLLRISFLGVRIGEQR